MFHRLLERYGRTVDLADRLTLPLCAGLLAVVVGLNAVEIFARYVLGQSSPLRVELSLTLSTAMYFLGYLVLLKRDEDVVMEYFYNWFPERARRWLDVMIALAIVFFFALLLLKSIDLFQVMSMMFHPVFPIPQSVTVLPILAASVGCLWVASYKALVAIDRLRQGSAPDSSP